MPPPPGVPAQGGQFQGREPIQVGFAPAAPQSRVTIFFRWLMIIPHAIVLYFVQIGAAFVFFIGWWAALFTGRMPEGMRNLGAVCLRYNGQVNAYVYLLTDRYPYSAPLVRDRPRHVQLELPFDAPAGIEPA